MIKQHIILKAFTHTFLYNYILIKLYSCHDTVKKQHIVLRNKVDFCLLFLDQDKGVMHYSL